MSAAFRRGRSPPRDDGPEASSDDRTTRDGKKLSRATVNATVNVLKVVISRAVTWDVLPESLLRKPIERLKPNPSRTGNDAARKAFLAAFDDAAGFHAWIEKTMPRGNVREIARKDDRFGGRRRHGAS